MYINRSELANGSHAAREGGWPATKCGAFATKTLPHIDVLEDILYQHINIISQWSLTCVTPAPNAYHELQLSAGDQSCCTPTVNVHTRQKKSARKDLKVVVLVTWCCCLLYILEATYYAVNILDSVHEDHISYMLHV